METIGCLIALPLLLLALLVDLWRWIPLKPDDRVGGGAWIAVAAAGSLITAASLQRGPLDTLDLLSLGVAAASMLVWALNLRRRDTPRPGLDLASRVLLAASFLTLAWLIDSKLGPDTLDIWRPLTSITTLANAPLDARGHLQLFGIVTLVMAAIHAPWKPAGPARGPWRLPWATIRLTHALTATLAWAALALVTIFSLGVVFEADWARSPLDPLAEAIAAALGQSLIVFVTLTTLLGCGLILGSQPWSAQRLKALPLDALRRSTRRRLDLPRRPGLLEAWTQILPTTAAPIFAAALALAWAADALWAVLAIGALGAATALTAGLRAWKKEAPFDALTIDLAQARDFKGLDSLAFDPAHGLLLKRGFFVSNEFSPEASPGDAEPPPQDALDEDAVTVDGLRAIAVKPERVVQIGLKPRNPEADDKKAQRLWRAFIKLDTITLGADIPKDPSPEQQLHILADLWTLAHLLDCELRLPHRRFDRPQLHGQLTGRIASDYEAWQSAPGSASADTATPWTSLKTESDPDDTEGGGKWWLAPKGDVFISGFWWIALLGVGLACEAYVHAVTVAVEGSMAAALSLGLRGLFLVGLGMEFARLRLLLKDPEVYVLGFRPEGIWIQRRLYAWDGLVDLNALPLNDFPLAFVHEGKLIGLPCPLPPEQRFALIEDIAEALRGRKGALRSSHAADPKRALER